MGPCPPPPSYIRSSYPFCAMRFGVQWYVRYASILVCTRFPRRRRGKARTRIDDECFDCAGTPGFKGIQYLEPCAQMSWSGAILADGTFLVTALTSQTVPFAIVNPGPSVHAPSVHPTPYTLRMQTAAWNPPIPITRILGYNTHAICRYHGGVFVVHYLAVSRLPSESERKVGCSFILSADTRCYDRLLSPRRA